ncbi:MAG: pyridoxamine 5'-phosphate oxidase family protein [Hyphomonas sp.]|nr:pyridoxamine 5'-phosphate oxidase family protein [Hyphomonas sp.]
MGQTYDKLDDRLIDFISKQKMFFVATAPLSADGHVNVSPKGYDSFVVISPDEVAYLDLGGSGIETQAHVQENGRITIMFCAFEGAANILRLYGQGEAVDFDHQDYERMLALFPGYDSARAIIRVKLSRVQDSCGWGVPFYDFRSDRDQLKRWAESKDKGEQGRQAWRDKNAASIDGLPGLKGARRS